MTMFVFQDQARFMRACGQTTEEYNAVQIELYKKLIEEECREELLPAIGVMLDYTRPSAERIAEVVDGALDTIVVCIGLLHSLGLDPQPLWNEVARSNAAKVDSLTGMVCKRPDGKVLKPTGWTPPQLLPLIKEQLQLDL